MNVRMAASGTIVIEAENELDSYALRKWCKDNPELPAHMLVDTNFPARLTATPVHEVEDVYNE